jgi:hypothetical protein
MQQHKANLFEGVFKNGNMSSAAITPESLESLFESMPS